MKLTEFRDTIYAHFTITSARRCAPFTPVVARMSPADYESLTADADRHNNLARDTFPPQCCGLFVLADSTVPTGSITFANHIGRSASESVTANVVR